jgi:hypothetical protein
VIGYETLGGYRARGVAGDIFARKKAARGGKAATLGYRHAMKPGDVFR